VTAVLEKVFRVLDCFTTPATVLSLAELSSLTGIPKPTVHRLAGDLVEWRALERTETGFRLGVRLFELGGLVHLNDQVREIAVPFMTDLYETTHEIIHLGVLDRTEVLYLAKLTGHSPVPAPSRVAGRMPLHCTALGKALLAFSPRYIVEDVLRHPLAARTPYTITSPCLLRDQLVEIRRTGIAVELEESQIGLACVGSPIIGRSGSALTAISVSGPVQRIDPECLGSRVKAAASAISYELSKRYPETRRW
jgi:DNA-binding IclR family transcriptional regulator